MNGPSSIKIPGKNKVWDKINNERQRQKLVWEKYNFRYFFYKNAILWKMSNAGHAYSWHLKIGQVTHIAFCLLQKSVTKMDKMWIKLLF